MAEWMHRYARVNAIDMHYVEQGAGPLVILCHGFPHIWFSWHRQIPALAAAGWRVVAPDMRGMGQTGAPAEPSAYDVDHTVGDLIGLLDHLGERQAVFVGLDFGILTIYDLALRHPDRVRAVIGLENPFPVHDPAISPLAEAAQHARDHFIHIDYFRPYGPADAALNAEPRRFLSKVFYALSGDYRYLNVWSHPPGTSYIDALPEPPPLPWAWLSELELEFFVSEYSRSGFTGGLNWYRAMDIRWEQRRAFEGVKSTPPFYFIGSENDVDLEAWHGDDPIAHIPHHHADVRAVRMLPKAGHMMQLERTPEVNATLVEFLGMIAAA